MALIKLKKMVSLPQKKIPFRIIMSLENFSFSASCTCICSMVQITNVFKLQRKELPLEINLIFFFWIAGYNTIHADLVLNYVTVFSL